MFDFAADARNEGGVKGRNNKGLITYDRKTKKDAFYIYQAYWTTDPMIHVCGERFVDRTPEERNITEYTNCDSVTLMVNGQAYASQNAVDHAVVFENVALQDGANTVSAVSGDTVSNTITVNAVAEHNFAYDLPEGNQGANWFNDPAAVAARKALSYPAGYYNIKDKVSVLFENPETEAVLASVLGDAAAQIKANIVPSASPMAEFMGMMRFNDMNKMSLGLPADAMQVF